MAKISSFSSLPTFDAPKSPPSLFSQSSLLGKIARIIVALFLILVSLGLILIAYRFSDLLNCKFCITKTTELPIPSTKIPISSPPVPTTPPYQKKEPTLPQENPQISENLLSQKVVQDYLSSGRLPELAILDNSQMFQFMCVLHDQYPELLPNDCLIPLTIFNYREEICNTIQDKLKADQGQYCSLGDLQCPITCSPENYHQLLQQSRVLPFLLWYDPEPTNHQQTLEKMQEIASLGTPGNSHWTVIVVDLDARCITYFDSLVNYIASTDEMEYRMKSLACCLANIGLCKNNGCPFDVHVAVNESLQNWMGSCCGLWCCQYMKWYMDRSHTRILQRIPDSLAYKTLLLQSLHSTFEKSMKKYADLSWPTT